MAIPIAPLSVPREQWADELVVTSAGNSSQMVDVTRDADQVFYLDASMSLSTLLASALPRIAAGKGVGFHGRQRRNNPGMLMVERDLNLPNFTMFCVEPGLWWNIDLDLPNKPVMTMSVCRPWDWAYLVV